MIVELCDELLQHHGYRTAYGWHALNRIINHHGGDGVATGYFKLCMHDWIQLVPEMPWAEIVSLFQSLVTAGKLESYLQDSTESFMLSFPRPTESMDPPRQVIANLKQHGLKEHEISNLAVESYHAGYPATDDPDRFIKYALQQHYSKSNTQKSVLIDYHWSPSPNCIQSLVNLGIPEDFIRTRIAEFWLYWSEMGTPRTSYEATFTAFIKTCWKNQSTSCTMTDEWKPSADIANYWLKTLGYESFQETLFRFRIYWKDRGSFLSQDRWEQLFHEYAARQVKA